MDVSLSHYPLSSEFFHLKKRSMETVEELLIKFVEGSMGHKGWNAMIMKIFLSDRLRTVIDQRS